MFECIEDILKLLEIQRIDKRQFGINRMLYVLESLAACLNMNLRLYYETDDDSAYWYGQISDIWDGIDENEMVIILFGLLGGWKDNN